MALSKEQVLTLQQRWWTNSKDRFGSLEEMLQEAAKLGGAVRDPQEMTATKVSMGRRSYTQADIDNARNEGRNSGFDDGLHEAYDIVDNLHASSGTPARREGYKRAMDAIRKRAQSSP